MAAKGGVFCTEIDAHISTNGPIGAQLTNTAATQGIIYTELTLH